MVTDSRNCEQCGVLFTPRREHARFCSARCRVAWNRAERSWDCPCHGSRFAPDGAVLQGPAVQPLAPRTV